ncbi:MAG TPA: glutamate formimidoyltransferase [Christensenellaceae bacterium]|jgi:glutamate formiminotransferase|nr:glutamate formimidoyltransferase [Christensenellaceae bacterium]
MEEIQLKTIMQCVPNYSEGRNLDIINKIAECFKGKEGVRLLDYSSDEDHNRSVFTIIGEPETLRDAVIASCEVALNSIDLRNHKGQHPRMGAVDVIPFIPIKNYSIKDADDIAKQVGKYLGEELNQPVYLYEKSATNPSRENLADVRRGEFEGLFEKMQKPGWEPDFGPTSPNPSGGATAVGARMPLIAFNVNLATDRLEIARDIAKKIRHSNGGFRYIKAMGVMLEEKNIAQVSMNVTDYTKTSLYRVFETIKMEAQRYGVGVVGSELIGLAPMQAFIDSAQYYLRLENFSPKQVLENRLLEVDE